MTTRVCNKGENEGREESRRFKFHADESLMTVFHRSFNESILTFYLSVSVLLSLSDKKKWHGFIQITVITS